MFSESSSPVLQKNMNHFNEKSGYGFFTDTAHYYNRGRVAVWKKTETGFTHQQTLTVSVDGHLFGTTVRTNEEGTMLFVGAAGNSDGMYETGGKIYIYRLKAGFFVIDGSFISSDDYRGNKFGSIFEVTDDGEQVIVGDPHYNFIAGAVRIYAKDKTGVWKERQLLTIGNTSASTYKKFGESISIDGKCMLVSAGRYGHEGGIDIMFKRRKSGSWTSVKNEGSNK